MQEGKGPPKGRKFQKEMWNWEWRKTRAAQAAKDAAMTGKEVPQAQQAQDNEPAEVGEESKFQYPLVVMSEIPKQYVTEMQDTIMSAVDRFNTDLGKACEYIKQEFDRLYEPMWHCVIGTSYGFDITYDERSVMYMFYNGNLAILVWKLVTF